MRMLASKILIAFCVLAPGCNRSESGLTAPAAAYPRKTVTIICPWAAGGGTDRLARFWADALNKKFDRPFVVVNRTGGSGACRGRFDAGVECS